MKHSSLLFLCLISFNACADNLYSGFYALGRAGATVAQFEIDQSLVADVPNAVTLMRPVDINVQGTSFAGSIGLGYSYQFTNHFVFGAEFDAGWMHDEGGETNELTVSSFNILLNSTVTATLKNDFALLFKPGYVFKEKTQFYALVGPRWGYYESSVATEFMFGNPTTLSGSAKDNASGYVLGVTAGVGMQRLLTDHLSVGLEYAYTSYGNIPSPETSIVLPTTPDQGLITDNPNLKSSTHSVMAMLAYYF